MSNFVLAIRVYVDVVNTGSCPAGLPRLYSFSASDESVSRQSKCETDRTERMWQVGNNGVGNGQLYRATAPAGQEMVG